MTNIFKTFVAILAFTALFASTSFAGSNDPIDCARQYRNCLNNCSQQEAAAKAAKANCERQAKLAHPTGGAAYNAAIKACRDTYNTTMQSVANCRSYCKTQHTNCEGGGYEEEG